MFLTTWLRMRNKHDVESHAEAAPQEKNGLAGGNNIRPALISAYERIPGVELEIDAVMNLLLALEPCLDCRQAGGRIPVRTQVRIYQARKRLKALKLNLQDAKKEIMLASTLSTEPDDGSMESCIGCSPTKPFATLDGSASSSEAAERAFSVPTDSFELYGRPQLVSDIAQQLCSGDTARSRVAILATAGIGKTAVAVKVVNNEAVMKTFEPEHRFWVPCKGITSADALLQTLKVFLRVYSNTGYSLDPLTDIVHELRISDHPRLVIFDNFESPWHDAEPEEREGIQRVLYSLSWLSHVAILITSNIAPSGPSHEMHISWQLHHLSPLGPEARRALYTEICPAAGHNNLALNNLLEALGPMPYDIKAVAAYGKASGYSLPLLLANWKASGSKMFSEVEAGGFIDFALMNEKPMVRSLLVTLALLPLATRNSHLSWWAPTCISDESSLIGTLRNLALLDPERGWYISTYPFVRSYMERSNRISAKDRTAHHEAAFKIVCDRKLFFGDDSRSKGNYWDLQMEETNLRHVLTNAAKARLETNLPAAEARDDSYNRALLESLFVFGRFQLKTTGRPDRDICLLAMQLARELNSDLRLAEASLGLVEHCID